MRPRQSRSDQIVSWVVSVIAVVVLLSGSPLSPRSAKLVAQAPADTMGFYKGLDLEAAGKYRDAAPLFRSALHSAAGENALLGLERVYSELGSSDSLLPPLDSLIASNPQNETFHTVEIRTLESLGRTEALRQAFEAWVRDAPGSAVPYREYASLLLEKNEAPAADSVLASAEQSLGSVKGLELQVAEARAAEGRWVESAQAWRQAFANADYLAQTAAYALAPAPSASRDQIRQIFLAPPIEVAARRALANLESAWGAPADAWNALKDLTPDSLAADAWTEFATQSESAEQWGDARAALEAALRWKHVPDLALRAATASLNVGDPAAALRLAPLSDARGDSALIASTYLPIQARALAALGRPADIERLVQTYDHFLTPGTKNALTRIIARGWIQAGDMDRARAALAASGPEGDSSDAAGWLALYDGNMKTARALLRGGTESSPELALALGLIARFKADSAPAVGKAFLLLARADSAGAAAQFVAAADQTPEVRSLLLLIAAQLQSGLGNQTAAIALWTRIVQTEASTPEAPEAELAWARLLRKRGDLAGAKAHLEHLILTYQQSALLPQARRELEQTQSATPPSI